ncbi:MAG TPA: DUF4097 family beta strand repeat-containing protein [Gemmatimonadaceae bacterium]|nr:DUF4097 family beta strand repeat-containing protein [Gemmatimonadaceae bacterium]
MADMRALFVFLLAAAPAGAQTDAPTFDWSGSVPAGATVHVDDVDGNIRVTGTSGGDVKVHGERTHVLSGGRALVFAVVKSGNDVTICAYHPGGECNARGAHGGAFHVNVSGQSPSADLIVELPPGINVAAASGDGEIEIHGAGADVKAESGDGAITIDHVQHAVSASTGDGSIEVHLAKAVNAGDIDLHSGDGTVTVYAPREFGAQLDASTGDGSIESDMKLSVEGRMDREHVRGTVGSGGDVRLKIRTGDGDIRLKQE